jgi:hypothetical protein
MGVKVTTNFKNTNEFPLELPCPNESCHSKINFKLGDIAAGNTVRCASCGVDVKLNEEN